MDPSGEARGFPGRREGCGEWGRNQEAILRGEGMGNGGGARGGGWSGGCRHPFRVRSGDPGRREGLACPGLCCLGLSGRGIGWAVPSSLCYAGTGSVVAVPTPGQGGNRCHGSSLKGTGRRGMRPGRSRHGWGRAPVSRPDRGGGGVRRWWRGRVGGLWRPWRPLCGGAPGGGSVWCLFRGRCVCWCRWVGWRRRWCCP